MTTYNGQDFTTFRGVNTRGSIALRFVADGGFEGTLAIKESADQAFAWKLPHKTGTFPIAGTFQVSLPTAAVANGSVVSTIVTVSGIRAEDALTCSLQGAFATAGISLAGAVPGNGNITLYFSNTSGGILNVLDRTVAYTAAR
jgi:hypothetical protein